MTKPFWGKKSPGSFAPWVSDLENPDKKVPCNGCTACCRAPTVQIVLSPEESEDFPEAVTHPEKPQFMVLPKKPDGTCVYLIQEECSIYGRRPSGCRSYDCRSILVGLAPLRNLDERAYAWEIHGMWNLWSVETVEDQLNLIAFSKAHSEVSQRRDQQRFDEMVLNLFRTYMLEKRADLPTALLPDRVLARAFDLMMRARARHLRGGEIE